MNDTPVFDDNPRAEEIVRHLEALVGEAGVSEDYVRLRIGLLRAQTAALAELADAPDVSPPTQQPIAGPLLRPQTVGFDREVARRLFDDVREVLRACGDPGVDLGKLQTAVDDEPALLEELMARAAFDPDGEYLAALAERLEVSAGLLLLAGRVLAAPFVTLAARRIKPPAASVILSDGYCPICDSPPALAQLRAADGKRVLHCSLCGHAWPFERLACPFCGSQDQAALGKLMVEGEHARWIEACRHCKHFLKTVDQRQLPEGSDVVPLVEEVAGLYLDLLAEKEGYLPKPPYAAM